MIGRLIALLIVLLVALLRVLPIVLLIPAMIFIVQIIWPYLIIVIGNTEVEIKICFGFGNCR